ncbi:UTRA domain-containing protein [Streptosporangiaceae bacterium NEAU-GS5]|nr:UTRA domain-containing protein [Streptosporangiaceae bacterium NEAU-GS5]
MVLRLAEPIVRRVDTRLRRNWWEGGRSIWDRETGGRPYSVDEISVEQLPAPEPIGDGLGFGEVWVRRRRYAVEDCPVQLALSYYPADIATGTAITQIDSGPGGVYARLTERGHAPATFTEELRARMPTPWERERLNLPPGVPVLSIVRTAWTSEGRPVEVAVLTLDASSYVLRYSFDAVPAVPSRDNWRSAIF